MSRPASHANSRRARGDPAQHLVSNLINEHASVQEWPNYSMEEANTYTYSRASQVDEALFGSELDAWTHGMQVSSTQSRGINRETSAAVGLYGPMGTSTSPHAFSYSAHAASSPHGSDGTAPHVPSSPEGHLHLSAHGPNDMRMVCCCLCARVLPGSWYSSADYAVRLLVLGGLIVTGTDARHAPPSHNDGNDEDNLDLNTAVPVCISLCSMCTPAHVRMGRGFHRKPCHMTWWGVIVALFWATCVVALWLGVRFFFWENTPFEHHHLHSALLADLLLGSLATTLSALFLISTAWSGTLAREAHRYARLYHVVGKVAQWRPPTCCGKGVVCVRRQTYEAYLAKVATSIPTQATTAGQSASRTPIAKEGTHGSINQPAAAEDTGRQPLSEPLLIHTQQPNAAGGRSQPTPLRASAAPVAAHLTPSLRQHSALQASLANQAARAEVEMQSRSSAPGHKAAAPHVSRTSSLPSLSEHDLLDPEEGLRGGGTQESKAPPSPSRRELPEGVAEVEEQLGSIMTATDVSPDGLARTIEDPATAELIVNRTTWFVARCVLLSIALANVLFRVSTDVRTVTPAWINAGTPIPAQLYPFASILFETLPTIIALGYAYQCTLVCEMLSGIAASLRSNRCKVADATWLTVLVLRRVQFLNTSWGMAAMAPALQWAFEAIVTALEAVLNGGFDGTIFAVSLVDFVIMLPMLLVSACLVKSMTDLVNHASNLRRLRVLRALRLLDASCTDSGRLVLMQELALCDGLANTIATSNLFARIVGVPITFSLLAKFYTFVGSALYLFGRLVSTTDIS